MSVGGIDINRIIAGDFKLCVGLDYDTSPKSVKRDYNIGFGTYSHEKGTGLFLVYENNGEIKRVDFGCYAGNSDKLVRWVERAHKVLGIRTATVDRPALNVPAAKGQEYAS